MATNQLHEAAFRVAAAVMRLVGPRVAGHDRPWVARRAAAGDRRVRDPCGPAGPAETGGER